MASFNPKRIVLSEINSGNRYNDGDVVSAESVNQPIEAAAYSQAYVESFATAPDNSEAGIVGVPTVEIVANGSYKKFKFKNLKGNVGDKGTQWFIATGNLSTAPTGARIGDIVQNGGSSTYTLGTLSMAIGDLAAIKTISPFALDNATRGNLRGVPGSGCIIVVNGVSQGSVSFSSDPQTQLNGKVNNSSVGVANGVASLDASGKLTASQKPTYSKNDIGLGSVDNEKQYSASNPPTASGITITARAGLNNLTNLDAVLAYISNVFTGSQTISKIKADNFDT